MLFLFCAPATPQIYTLSLHDALPISTMPARAAISAYSPSRPTWLTWTRPTAASPDRRAFSIAQARSEEHTSELQSLRHLVCRLLLEKKKVRTLFIRSAEATVVLCIQQ